MTMTFDKDTTDAIGQACKLIELDAGRNIKINYPMERVRPTSKRSQIRKTLVDPKWVSSLSRKIEAEGQKEPIVGDDIGNGEIETLNGNHRYNAKLILEHDTIDVAVLPRNYWNSQPAGMKDLYMAWANPEAEQKPPGKQTVKDALKAAWDGALQKDSNLAFVFVLKRWPGSFKESTVKTMVKQVAREYRQC